MEETSINIYLTHKNVRIKKDTNVQSLGIIVTTRIKEQKGNT